MTPHRNGKLDINVTYNNRSELIKCMRDEVADEIETRFGISLDTVSMYSINKNKKARISLNSVTDLMRIHLVPKENGLRSIQSYKEITTTEKMLDNIMSKLKHNTSLNGQERKALLEGLQTHSTAFFTKRKLDETDFRRTNVSHKKVQVDIYSQNSKESFAQTDPFRIAENDVENLDHDNSEKEDPIIKLKKLWKMDNKPMEEIEILMQETYDARRTFLISQMPPVRIVKEQYPALFCVEMVKNELDRLFYPGKCLEFSRNMEKYSKYILYYNVEGDNKIHDRIKKALERARTALQKTYAAVVGSIFVLAQLLEEGFGFIHLKDYPHGSDDVFPYIDASCHSLKELFFDEILYVIRVEGNLFCEATNFSEAMLCLIAAFFIFHIHYPESHCRTLTVVEKLFLEANDTTVVDELTSQMIKALKLQACKDYKD